jgi:CO/xanthine dehydrogenase Mo-binding subunit
MAFVCRRLSKLPIRAISDVGSVVSPVQMKNRAQQNIIGVSTTRSEGREKVSGAAIYATDVILPDMLWAKALRSPIAYGKIKKLDVGKAQALAGVRAVVTGADAKGLLIGRKIYDMPVLTDGVVRFIGEKVAAVAADSEEIAETALELIDVDYEEFAPLLDPLEAVTSAAPLLHPDVARYRGLLHEIKTPSNVFVDLTWTKGDIDEGFRAADFIVENTFTTQPIHQAYIEPHSCVVLAKAAGGGDVWACSKVPFALRDQVATALQKSTGDFVVHPCYIGGCFGGKGDFMDVPVSYLLSLKSGRPVKMVMDYSEEFVAGNPRHGAVVKVKTGVRKDGTLVAHRMEFIYDSGAYGAFKPQGYLVGPKEAAGPYKIPHVFINEKIVYTNKIPCGHMRAPGEPQAFFANESQMDLVARRLGMDPIEFRQKNLLHDGDISPVGHIVPHVKSDAILAAVLENSGYRRAKGKRVGRGLALAQWLPLGGEGHGFVTVDERGMVTVATAMVDQGAGTYTAMRQIAANELKVPIDHVGFEILDTSQVAADTGVGASRATRIFGSSIHAAALQVKEKLLRAASEMLDVNADTLEFTGRAAVRANGDKQVSFRELVEHLGAPIRCEGSYKNFDSGPEAALCAQVAEVEVDDETGAVKLRRFTTAHSTGTIINPLMHQGQIDGGVVMALGYSMMEQLSFDQGRVTTTNFGESKIPSIRDIPPLKTVIQEFPVGNGPYGGMSIGEPPVLVAAAAIANAVHDAVGVRIYDLPITAEKVLRALKSRMLE